jgi:hypothetical protein
VADVLIRRTVVADQAYAVLDIDTPGESVLAVAWKSPEGWNVGVGEGRIVAENLTKRQAMSAMHRAAGRELHRAATSALLRGVAR